MLHHYVSIKLASYTSVHVAVFFHLIMYANIKVTKRYTAMLFYEFAGKQQKADLN